MDFKGIISNNEEIHVLKGVVLDVDLRIQKVNENLGRMYLVDEDGDQWPFPEQFWDGRSRIWLENDDGEEFHQRGNELHFTYSESYTILVNGRQVARLEHQKKHILSTAEGILYSRLQQ